MDRLGFLAIHDVQMKDFSIHVLLGGDDHKGSYNYTLKCSTPEGPFDPPELADLLNQFLSYFVRTLRLPKDFSHIEEYSEIVGASSQRITQLRLVSTPAYGTPVETILPPFKPLNDPAFLFENLKESVLIIHDHHRRLLSSDDGSANLTPHKNPKKPKKPKRDRISHSRSLWSKFLSLWHHASAFMRAVILIVTFLGTLGGLARFFGFW